ncbi:MAG: Rossmann-like and DUF2520 domain-containing protein [Saprospiraceae bacterium]
MKIVCIGAGRLAHQLMPALQDAGCRIIQVYNRTPETAKSLAEQFTSCSFTSNIEEIVKDADAYFMTLSDDVIHPFAEKLVDQINSQSLVVHCSGSLGLEVIPFERKAGFYPLQSFSDQQDLSFRYIPIIITAQDDDIWIMLDQVAGRLSSTVYRMTEQQKSILHVAAVFANNFSNHMLTMAETICNEHHLPFEILKPLILETFSKAILSGPKASQTGPAIRGDQKTIEKHLRLLENNPELREVYEVVTKSIMSF